MVIPNLKFSKMGGGGYSGLQFQKGVNWRIWTKIYCSARNLLVHHSSLSHTTYVETNNDSFHLIRNTTFSGLEPGGPSLISQCGRSSRKEIVVTTAEPFNIRFQSDGFFTEKGFAYQLIPEPQSKLHRFTSIKNEVKKMPKKI